MKKFENFKYLTIFSFQIESKKILMIMKSYLIFSIAIVFIRSTNANQLLNANETEWDLWQFTGYHFHTYFFQDNPNSTANAITFRFVFI